MDWNWTMQQRRFVVQAANTVLLNRRRTGMMGCAERDSQMMKNTSDARDKGRAVRGKGWFQGTRLPPALRPRRRRTRKETRDRAPVKSMRER